jgi:hypothetical protein
METGVSWTATGTGSATEATMLANAVTALQAEPNIAAAFSITHDGVDDVVLTARTRNKAYTIACTGGTSAVTAPAVSSLQDPGGSKLAFGFVALDSDRHIVPLSATTELADLAGILRYSEGNHYRDSIDDTEIAVVRGKKYAVVFEGRGWAPYSGTVPSSSVYLRRATTSGAGTVGELLAAPAGTGATYTFTPSAVNLAAYGFAFSFRGRRYSAHVTGDGSTTVAQAVTALVARLGSIAGLAITDSTTTVTVACDGAEDLDWTGDVVSIGDSGTASITIANTVAADIDTIDISSIAKVIDSNSTGFVELHVRI